MPVYFWQVTVGGLKFGYHGHHCYIKIHLSSHDLDKVFLNSTCLIVTPTLDPVACVHISPGSMGTGILPVSVRIANLSSFTSVLRGA